MKMNDITEPVIYTANLERYAASDRKFQGIPGIECDGKGMLWATWYSGGVTEGPDNYVVLARSDDDGASWRDPVAVIDPPGITRAFDPCLWRSPDGHLRLFWSQSDGWTDGRMGVWMATVESSTPISFSKPRRIANGVMMNKPTVLSNGEWLLPISLWHADITSGYFGDKGNDPLKNERAANVYASRSGGEFLYRGGVDIPGRSFDEHMVVERKDGLLVMYVRTKYGIAESVSADGGRMWRAGVPSKIAGPCSRFFIRRLRSGKLLIVNHYQFTGRSHMTASISDDDGVTWYGHLLLDERTDVSYPDGVESEDGTIYIIYDRERQGAGEILMARFTEAEVVHGKIKHQSSQLKMVVSRMGRKE
ncbi:MAG: sialidase family protein [Victivallales bacterium]